VPGAATKEGKSSPKTKETNRWGEKRRPGKGARWASVGQGKEQIRAGGLRRENANGYLRVKGGRLSKEKTQISVARTNQAIVEQLPATVEHMGEERSQFTRRNHRTGWKEKTGSRCPDRQSLSRHGIGGRKEKTDKRSSRKPARQNLS